MVARVSSSSRYRVSFEQVGMLRLRAWQLLDDGGHVLAHRGNGGVRVALVDRFDDVGVLLDEECHPGGATQDQARHTIHVGLEVSNTDPGERTTDAVGEGEVKLLVLPREGAWVVPCGGLGLCGQDCIQVGATCGEEVRAGLADDGGFYRLAD